MVKNVSGGNDNKKFARKHSSGANTKAGNKLRTSQDENEIYAVVTKNLGNNMFNACATNGVLYLCHIRGKFSGRHRRDNNIAGGVWVLIGLLEWNSKQLTASGKVKLRECDLLEVYSEMDKTRLKDSVSEDWSNLIKNDPSIIDKSSAINEDNIVWQTDKDIERSKLVEELKSEKTLKISLTANAGANEKSEMEVYVDDI
jgi:translation initiation factor IF-1